MSAISSTLDWDGLWEMKEDDIPSNIPNEEGIYMVLCGKPSSDPDKWDTSSYKLLYIGEAEKVRTRIVGHKKWPKWKKNCTNHILLKVAKCKLGTVTRQKVECCLIYNTKPTCNDECKDAFPYYDDTVSIINQGMKSPLKNKYTCSG